MKDHINIYSQSDDLLGRMLSNFYRCNVQTDHGLFQSVEGYWYYLQSGDELLRDKAGYDAKKYGKKVKQGYLIPEERFKEYICFAIGNKIYYNEMIYEQFIESELPFDHYYIYGGDIVRPPKGNEWVVEFITYFRDYLKGNE